MTELEIQAFLMVVKAGSITAAAQQLYVTQPALSRRIHALEAELGYSLMERKKGMRSVELTLRGKAFVTVAEKMLAVWSEAKELAQFDSSKIFHISSVGSVSTYILPPVFLRFMKNNPDCRLVFHNHHSREAYEYIENRQTDMAFISDTQFSRAVETVPAFREKMLLISNEVPGLWSEVHPSTLNVNQEIRLPWNPEYDLWHDYWFGANAVSKVILDQMSLLEDLLNEKNTWAVVPASVADKLTQNEQITLHQLLDAPSDRIIYYVVPKNQKNEYVQKLLSDLDSALQKNTTVESFL
ncbi:LysR family transcriptional regulator [Faecalispora anaeroviscerum]|uniref:LysR family transcriptional regulator n=1 Tax=Faecalispora anaeroviscerum TaxID=2991836 RepID=UPI0024BB1E6E|nr:LysR family transcriptional regulator [Faecalispora anaeroviscerum]